MACAPLCAMLSMKCIATFTVVVLPHIVIVLAIASTIYLDEGSLCEEIFADDDTKIR